MISSLDLKIWDRLFMLADHLFESASNKSILRISPRKGGMFWMFYPWLWVCSLRHVNREIVQTHLGFEHGIKQ
jgi:hypothetical protein